MSLRIDFLKLKNKIKTQFKWCLQAAAIGFIVLLGGVFGPQQMPVPNQEIVLQFVRGKLSASDVQQAVAVVEQELQRIGISTIYVKHLDNGKLVISYFSKTDADDIKNILSSQEELALGVLTPENNKVPQPRRLKNMPLVYDLDVYDIHQGPSSYPDLSNQCAVEFKTGTPRFVKPNFYLTLGTPYQIEGLRLLKSGFGFQNYTVNLKNFQLYKFPEVRAGPFS